MILLALPLGGCVVEEDFDELEPRISVSPGGSQQQPLGRPAGGGFPDKPSDQCSGETQGSGSWCDCMGQAIDDMTDYFAACEDVLDGEGPIDVTLYVWCATLWEDFDSWWDEC
ncbi:MAG: hypothetical protein AB1Z98_18185 [Nannocystaceae bacterium]